jgi:competence protein ComK
MIGLMGEYDQYGKVCERVMAGKSAFLVNRSPIQLLVESLTFIGFELRGAIVGQNLY